MLTKITIRNSKCFDEVVVDLASPVVFIGPNNSGKTTALQALALWEIGIKHWNSKRKGKTKPEKRPGVTINRRDLVAVPVPRKRKEKGDRRNKCLFDRFGIAHQWYSYRDAAVKQFIIDWCETEDIPYLDDTAG